MKRMSKYACALALAICGFNGPAFTRNKDHSADRAARQYGRNARRRTVSAREVRHELVMLPYYGVFDNLAYRVDGSTVTLLGQVTRPTLKSDAENVVKDIEGVDQRQQPDQGIAAVVDGRPHPALRSIGRFSGNQGWIAMRCRRCRRSTSSWITER